MDFAPMKASGAKLRFLAWIGLHCLAVAPAVAKHTSPNWKAEDQLLQAAGPADTDRIYSQPLAEVARQMPAALPSAATVDLIEYDAPNNQYYEFRLSRRSDGLVEYRMPGDIRPYQVHDRFNLFELEDVTHLSISPAVTAQSGQQIITIDAHAIEDRQNGNMSVSDFHATFSGVFGSSLIETSHHHLYSVYHDYAMNPVDIGFERGQDLDLNVHLVFVAEVGMYFAAGRLEQAIDYRLNGGAWHSQTVSAHLSPDSKERARQFFAQGFDLYKSGDPDAAAGLIRAGLKIDPANALGWFSMAQIERSRATASNDYRVKGRMKTDLRHTIDLAPDSAEAIQAQALLNGP